MRVHCSAVAAEHTEEEVVHSRPEDTLVQDTLEEGNPVDILVGDNLVVGKHPSDNLLEDTLKSIKIRIKHQPLHVVSLIQYLALPITSLF